MIIRTKYLAQTNTKPTRVKAWCTWEPQWSVTISAPMLGDAHDLAFRKLAEKTKPTGAAGFGKSVWMRGELSQDERAYTRFAFTDQLISGV